MEQLTEIDIILISYAQTDQLKLTTINAINSLMISEDAMIIKFNIIVIESQKSMKPYQYPSSITIYPDEPFGYHRYLNIGIDITSSKYICLCNNDLMFHPGWATEILKPFQTFADVFSASPFCSIHHPKEGFKINDGLKLGYGIREHMAGWCIFLKRDLLKFTGMLDRNLIFWCADNDYSTTLQIFKFPHVLVTSSIVDHLESKTLNEQTEERRERLTNQETTYFKKKWYPRIGKGWQLMD